MRCYMAPANSITAKDESPLLDQREFEAFMNCEPTGVPKFEERIRVGPLPKVGWLTGIGMGYS